MAKDAVSTGTEVREAIVGIEETAHGKKVIEERRTPDGVAIVETDPVVESEIAAREIVDAAIGAKEGDEIAATGIISEAVVKEEKQKEHKPKKTRAQLEAEVNAARDDLGTTLDELVSKVYDLTPKNQAKKLKKTARHMALQTVADVRGFFAGEGMPADPERRKMVERVLKAAGGAAGLVLLRSMLKSIRKRGEKHAMKAAARHAAKEAAEQTARHAGWHERHGHHQDGGAPGGTKGRKGHGRKGHGRKGHKTLGFDGGSTTIIETGPIYVEDPDLFEH